MSIYYLAGCVLSKYVSKFIERGYRQEPLTRCMPRDLSVSVTVCCIAGLADGLMTAARWLETNSHTIAFHIGLLG